MDAVLLVQCGVVVAVLATVWVLLDLETWQERARQLGRRVGLFAKEPPAPPGPPIERLAADVRRIGSAVRHRPPGLPAARLRGWVAAYDDVLVAACRALDLEQRLESALRPGERELERERVERLLVRAGLLMPEDVGR